VNRTHAYLLSVVARFPIEGISPGELTTIACRVLDVPHRAVAMEIRTMIERGEIILGGALLLFPVEVPEVPGAV
jgi:hypothetical protein